MPLLPITTEQASYLRELLTLEGYTAPIEARHIDGDVNHAHDLLDVLAKRPTIDVYVAEIEGNIDGLYIFEREEDRDAFVEARSNDAELDALRERGTCSKCLARTYRGEECVCPGDDGDAEDVGDEFDALFASAASDITTGECPLNNAEGARALVSAERED